MRSLDVAWARMRSSGLIDAPFTAPADVVRHHGAMQAQDYGPAKWAIGQRSTGISDTDVDRALANGSIIRTHALRETWHFLARDDVRWIQALTGPRVHASMRPRLRQLDLDARTLARCERVITKALAGTRMTRNELAEVLAKSRIDLTGQRLAHILLHCELELVMCSGGLEGKQQTYALLDERVPAGSTISPDDASAELVRRYLSSHGPAAVRDLRWWSSLTTADIRQTLAALGDDVRSESVDGVELWSMATGVRPPRSIRGAELLHVYDELLVGYTETRYFGDPRAQQARAAWSDPSMPNGVVLIAGLVAGHWRRKVTRNTVDVEILLYDPPSAATERALVKETNRLGQFMGLQANLVLGRI